MTFYWTLITPPSREANGVLLSSERRKAFTHLRLMKGGGPYGLQSWKKKMSSLPAGKKTKTCVTREHWGLKFLSHSYQRKQMQISYVWLSLNQCLSLSSPLSVDSCFFRLQTKWQAAVNSTSLIAANISEHDSTIAAMHTQYSIHQNNISK